MDEYLKEQGLKDAMLELADGQQIAGADLNALMMMAIGASKSIHAMARIVGSAMWSNKPPLRVFLPLTLQMQKQQLSG